MTYKKIAQLAGVSVSTVSKVMSGSHEIGKDTVARVLEIAEAHGVTAPKYHRNRIGTRVAVIVPEIISVYYSRLATAISEELEARNIIPCIYVTNFDKKQLSRIIDSITDSKIDGIISTTHTPLDKPAAPPMVHFLIGHQGAYDSVGIDHDSAIFEAVEYLVKLGHTDIGFIGEKLTNAKLISFKKSATALKLTISDKNIFVSKKRFEEIGYEAVKYFVKRKNLPTALLCAYDEIAMGAIHAFKHYSVRVPEDISVIGMNDIPYAAYAEIPLTTISIANREAPRLAVEMLCDRITDPSEKKAHHILLKGELIIRETTDKPRKEKI